MESLPQRPPPARSLGESVRAWLLWFGVTRLVVSSLAVVAVGAGAYWLVRAPATPIENTLPIAAPSTTSSVSPAASDAPAPRTTESVDTSAPAPARLEVYVAGAVAAPGVYALDAGARVHDAIDAAGGLAADADVDALNLAAGIADGDRVYVPRVGQTVPTVVLPSGGLATETAGSRSEPGVTEPIDLNEATADQLDALPGVGPATAAAIVAHREQNGPFASVDDLLDVRGIGPAKLDAIRSLVRV